jgi:hypothetical protein
MDSVTRQYHWNFQGIIVMLSIIWPYADTSQFVFIGSCIYPTQVAAVKLAFLALYLRIFPGRTFRIATYIVALVNILIGIAFTFVLAFNCNPASFVWEGWDGTKEGTCIDSSKAVLVHAGLNIALDVIIVLMPIRELTKLNLSTKKKFGTALMFCFGFG